MKKVKSIFIYLLFTAILFSCKNEDPTSLVTFGYYIPQGNLSGSGYDIGRDIFISDKDGNTLIEKEALEGMLTTLEFEGDPDLNYTVSIIERWEINGEVNYVLFTYTEVDINNKVWNERPSSSGNSDIAVVTFENVGSNTLENFNSSIPYDSRNIEYDPVNQDQTVKFYLGEGPMDIYLTYNLFNEVETRYNFLENIAADSRDTINSSEAPLLDHFERITLPDNNSFRVSLSGSKDVDEYSHFLWSTKGNGENQADLYFPENIFTHFYTNIRIENLDGDDYSEVWKGDIPTDYTYSPISFEITNRTPELFEITSNSTYDYSRGQFYYEKPGQPSDYLNWFIYGPDTKKSYSLPFIQDAFIADFPDFNFQSMEFKNCVMVNIPAIGSYGEILDNRFDVEGAPETTGDYSVTLTKE